MAEKVVAFGRINNSVKFQYGPKDFSANWDSVFTALEWTNKLADLPHSPIEGTKGDIGKAGNFSQRRNLQLWLGRLEMVLLELDWLAIGGTKVKRLWVDERIVTHYVHFADKRKTPRELVGETLVQMKLNTWGIVQQIVLACSEFELKQGNGRRNISIFFTL